MLAEPEVVSEVEAEVMLPTVRLDAEETPKEVAAEPETVPDRDD